MTVLKFLFEVSSFVNIALNPENNKPIASSSTVDYEVIYSSNRTDKVNIMAQLRLQWQRIIQPKVGGGRDGRLKK